MKALSLASVICNCVFTEEGCFRAYLCLNKLVSCVVMGCHENSDLRPQTPRMPSFKERFTFFLKKYLDWHCRNSLISLNVLWWRNVHRQQPQAIYLSSPVDRCQSCRVAQIQWKPCEVYNSSRHFDDICWRFFFTAIMLLKLKSVLYLRDATAINRRR